MLRSRWLQLRPRLGNKVDLRGRTRAAETRLWRRRAAAPPLPLCRQVNWAFPSWAPRKKQSQSPTSLRAAASLRLGSPAHSSGLPGRGGATSCESLEAEPGRPLYLGLFLGPELHKDLAVLQLPIAFPLAPPGAGVHPPRLLPSWVPAPPTRVWFELSNPPIVALGAAQGGVLCPPSPRVARARIYKTLCWRRSSHYFSPGLLGSLLVGAFPSLALSGSGFADHFKD